MPVQPPVWALSVLPSVATPSIVGGETLAGAAGATCAVPDESAVAVPASFVAVTRTRTTRPTSALVSVYVAPVAPAIGVQFAPPWSHRSHAYAKRIGVVPLQSPSLETVKVEPSRAVPEIAGAVRFAGAAGATLSVGMSREVALPAVFVAVTLRMRTWPTSAPVSV